MHRAVVIASPALLLVLGALFLVPRPANSEDGVLRFDRRQLALLECHTQGTTAFTFADWSSPQSGADAGTR